MKADPRAVFLLLVAVAVLLLLWALGIEEPKGPQF